MTGTYKSPVDMAIIPVSRGYTPTGTQGETKVGTGTCRKTCAVCGTAFEVAPTVWRYKRVKHGKHKYACDWMCSYHCLRAWDAAHEGKPRREPYARQREQRRETLIAMLETRKEALAAVYSELVAIQGERGVYRKRAGLQAKRRKLEARIEVLKGKLDGCNND